MSGALRDRFSALWERVGGLAGPDAAWRSLDAGYGEAGRHYHDWRHVAALLAGHDAVRTLPDFVGLDADAIDLAIFFHDAVYDPGRQDNEALSAALLADSAGAASAKPIKRVAVEMILATAAHGPSTDPATRLLLDLDLAILGAPRPDYETYAAAIRREYAAIPDAAWRLGRAAVLDRFLTRARLYQTDHFRARFEVAARANLAAEAAALRS